MSAHSAKGVTGVEEFLQPTPLVTIPFDQVAVDIVGALLQATGNQTHILVLVDYATRYLEAVVLHSTLPLCWHRSWPAFSHRWVSLNKSSQIKELTL